MSEKARVYRLNRPTRLTLRASATLVVDGPRRFLVDDGDFATAAELDAALRSVVGFGLDGITDAYFTHLHFDHYKALAPECRGWRIHVPRQEYRFVCELMRYREDRAAYKAFLKESHELIAPVFLREFLRLATDSRYDFESSDRACEFHLCDPGEQLSPHVATVDLAGHCPGQMGLWVDTEQGACMIAGDAVLSLDDFLATGIDHHLIVHDRERLLASRRRVAEADFVVPGHGEWFDPRRGNLTPF